MRQLHVSSSQGTFDQRGSLPSEPRRHRSVQTGFVLYARAPRGPAFAVRFPPSYECTAGLGESGRDGVAGTSWSRRSRERPVEDIGSSRHLPAAGGRQGGAGGIGAPGPRFSVYVTWVRTPDYTKLLAARSEGDVDRVVLVAPGTPLSILARGGSGGRGGIGGDGAKALGASLPGGVGGRRRSRWTRRIGWRSRCLLRRTLRDIERMIVTDVRGGDGGAGGTGGDGGVGAFGDAVYDRRGRIVGYRPTGPAGPPGMSRPARKTRRARQGAHRSRRVARGGRQVRRVSARSFRTSRPRAHWDESA